MELEVKLRDKTGKEASKKLRRNGWIPGVVYGAGEKNIHVMASADQIQNIMKEMHGATKVLKMKLGGKHKDVFLKHIDRDPVTGKVIHVDLQVVHKGEEIHVEVPVEIQGTAKGTKLGGVLEVIHWRIPVRGDITKIPPSIEIDVSDLDINDSIHVRDLKLDVVKPLLNEDEAIVVVLPPKKMEEEKPVEAEIEAEEAAGEEEEEGEGEK